MTLTDEQRKQLVKAFRIYHKWLNELQGLAASMKITLDADKFEQSFAMMKPESKPRDIIWMSQRFFEKKLV